MGSNTQNMSGPTISIGLGARGLKDKDFVSVSDPYVTISRPDTKGGFVVLRTSETKKNTLNPDWSDFLFIESELNGNDKELNLRIEVFDDDGKKGPDRKDKLLGSGFYSLKQLEAAALVKSMLPLSDGKRQKAAGQLLVRSFKEHKGGPNNSAGVYGAGSGYSRQNQAPPGTSPAGYPCHGPAGGGGYPSYPPQPGVQQGGYPSAQAYPQGTAGYPQVSSGYPQIGNGYPQGPAYPQGGGGYPQAGVSYPQAGAGYPQATGGYPQSSGGYPQGGGGYPQVGGSFPAGSAPNPLYPPSNLPPGPAGGFFNPNP